MILIGLPSGNLLAAGGNRYELGRKSEEIWILENKNGVDNWRQLGKFLKQVM